MRFLIFLSNLFRILLLIISFIIGFALLAAGGLCAWTGLSDMDFTILIAAIMIPLGYIICLESGKAIWRIGNKMGSVD